MLVRQSEIGIDHARPDCQFTRVEPPGDDRCQKRQGRNAVDLRCRFGSNGSSEALPDDNNTACPRQGARVPGGLHQRIAPETQTFGKIDVVAPVAGARPVETEGTYAPRRKPVGDDAPELPRRAEFLQSPGACKQDDRIQSFTNGPLIKPERIAEDERAGGRPDGICRLPEGCCVFHPVIHARCIPNLRSTLCNNGNRARHKDLSH